MAELRWPSITNRYNHSPFRRAWHPLRLALNHQTAIMQSCRVTYPALLRLALNHQTAIIDDVASSRAIQLRLALNHQTAIIILPGYENLDRLRLALNHQTAIINSCPGDEWLGCGWPSITRPR